MMADTHTPTKVREGVRRMALHGAVSAVALVAGFVTAASAGAQEKAAAQRTVRFNIEAQELGEALNVFAAQSGLQVAVAPNDVRGKRSPAVQGTLTPRAALDRLVESSGLEYAFLNGNTVAVRQGAAAQEERTDGPATQMQTGTLTGRVTQAGKPVAGATVTATSEALEESRVVTTDEEGNYELTRLPPGEYSLRFELEGLVSVVKEAEVSPEESTTLDVQMSLHEVREDMVVVGSRLGSTPVESAMPITVITREEIDRSGATSIAQVLSQRPEVSVNNNGDTNIVGGVGSFGSDVVVTNATTVQLRGLPQGTTLVLVNGRRVVGSAASIGPGGNGVFDLSTLPLALVERIEILPFGASAIHGGDGLAGVVNIVLKQQASGFDVRTRYNFADGYDNTEAGFTWGKAGSRGSLTVTGSYSDLGTLTGSERSLTADKDFTRFGGLDFRTVLGNIYSLDGCPPPPEPCFVPLDQRGNLPGLNAPVAAIPTGQDGQNLSPGDFVGTAGLQNRSTLGGRFFSPAEQFSLSINGRYQVSSRLELFTDLVYTRRDVPASELALGALGGSFGVVVVPATNPFNPFGVDVGVDFGTLDTDVFIDFDNEYVKPLLGARGQWGRGDRRWDWEVAGWLSEDSSSLSPNLLLGGPDTAAINAALASSDPATALNPFRTDGGPLASPEVTRALFIPPEGQEGVRGDFSSRLWGVNGQVQGSLFRLPAGSVEGLLGTEYQREELGFLLPSSGGAGIDGGSDDRALFGELRVPLLARSASEHRELLALVAAVRAEESSRFEETGTTETLGLEFRPLPSLLLRASYSDAFKPLPLFAASDSDAMIPLGLTVTDPKMGGQTVVVSDGIFGGGIPPGLQPETSTTRSLGLVLAPESVPGLRLSLTAWDNRFRDRLAGFGSLTSGDTFDDLQFLVDNEDTLFPGRVIRDPETGVITALDLRNFNVNFVELAGLDVAFDWRFSTRVGTFSPSLAATYTDQYDEQVAPGLPLQSNLAVLRSTGWAAKWKLIPKLGWDYRDWLYTQLTGRYVSDYEDPRPLSTGPAAGTLQTLGDFWMLDLTLDFALGRWLAPGSPGFSETRLSLGAVNLFNRLPDFCNSCFSIGYDATQYDIRGRFVTAELKFNF